MARLEKKWQVPLFMRHPESLCRCLIVVVVVGGPWVVAVLVTKTGLQANSKVKFTAWPTSWRPPGDDRLWPRGTTVNSRIWLAP